MTAELAEKTVDRSIVTERLIVPVDYDVSLEEVVEELKKKNYRFNRNITSEKFPRPRKGQCEIEVGFISFGDNVSTDWAASQIEYNGLLPINLYDLFSLLKKYPNINFPVVALGSKTKDPGGNILIPFYDCNPSARFIRLRFLDVGWGESHQFGVKKE